MKICYVTSGSEKVGTYFRALFWAKYLVQAGHSVTLISSHEKPDWHPSRYKTVDGIRILTLIKTPVRFDYPGFIVRPFLIIAHLLTHEYDVIHSFVPWQPPSATAILIGRLLKFRRKNLRIFADWDDLWGTPSGIAAEHGRYLNALVTYLEGRLPKFADAVTVCSSFLARYAVSSGVPEAAITVIPNGSNTDEIRPLDKKSCRRKLKLSDSLFIALYIGQFHTDVFTHLIDACDDVHNTDRNFRLMIAGSIPDNHRRKISGANWIDFVGKIPYPSLSLYFSAADLLLLPMDETDTEKARFPIRFGDYVASGTPILSSPQGDVRDIITGSGIAFVSDIGNRKAFASVLRSMMREPKIRHKGRIARLWGIRNLSWRVIARQVEGLYESE
jgi:glycosyltransferase involved in cell wall biosynthesis